MNEALEAQKARFAKDEEQFKKREESLRTKDLHLQHQLIRFKLAEMARQVESMHDNVERVAFQFASGVEV